MKKSLFALALVLVAAPAFGATVVGTPHDLSAALPNTQQVCVFCHTPHQSGTSVDPLWNHTLSTVASYGVYASATLNATPTDIGGGTSASNLCMSCHDGTVGPGSLYNNPNRANGTEETPSAPWAPATLISGTALLGTDLSNDHPVNFTYDATLVGADGGLVAVGSLPSWALIGGQVQCSSCHDPHNNTNGAFLPIPNTNSAVCTSCHLK